MERTDQTQTQPTPATQPVPYYWIATIGIRGQQLTRDATIDVTPGIHTRMDITRSVMDFLREQHGEFVLLAFSLERNDLSAPAVTA
ncbi:hypothetical protein [Streptomyces sp. NPDC051636]|uniref:hypothetical protein n=1 Tax=Streptomyces sp. NPDC051636 TaxID=3365663 RepID=UPI0037B3D3B1